MHVEQDRIDLQASNKAAGYAELAEQLAALLDGETDTIANAANTSALLYRAMPDVNWVGFYFLQGQELVVGPFQGKPACARIPLGRGVCGIAAQEKETQVVDDVHAFANHITCDIASNSEIVVPLIRDGRLLGVLDIDSPKKKRFDVTDRAGIEKLALIYVASLE